MNLQQIETLLMEGLKKDIGFYGDNEKKVLLRNLEVTYPNLNKALDVISDAAFLERQSNG